MRTAERFTLVAASLAAATLLSPALGYVGTSPTITLSCDTRQVLVSLRHMTVQVKFTVTVQGATVEAGETPTADLVRAHQFTQGNIPANGKADWVAHPYFTPLVGLTKDVTSTEPGTVIPARVGDYCYVALIFYHETATAPYKRLFSNVVVVNVMDARPPYQTVSMPMFGGINLATGEMECDDGIGLTVDNRTGPSVDFDLINCSAQARVGYQSAGLWPGWVHNYDLQITSLGDAADAHTGHLVLTYPNGGRDTLTLSDKGIAQPPGAPYAMTGTTEKVSINGADVEVWKNISMYRSDMSRWDFSLPPGDTTYAHWRVSAIADSVGRGITLNWNDGTNGPAGSLATVTDSDGKVLLQCSYTNGHLDTVKDDGYYLPADQAEYGHRVNYTTGGPGPELVAASFPHKAADAPANKDAYAYDTIVGATTFYLLKKVTDYTTGAAGGAVTTIIRGDDGGLKGAGLIVAIKDPMGNVQNFTTTGPNASGERSTGVGVPVPQDLESP